MSMPVRKFKAVAVVLLIVGGVPLFICGLALASIGHYVLGGVVGWIGTVLLITAHQVKDL